MLIKDGLTNIQQGDYILGIPTRGDLRTWSRWDLYIPTGKRDSVRIIGKDDTSPLYKHWREENYNSTCTCCYLGHGHSEEYHNSQIK